LPIADVYVFRLTFSARKSTALFLSVQQKMEKFCKIVWQSEKYTVLLSPLSFKSFDGVLLKSGSLAG